MARISALSSEYVKVQISAKESGVAVDPTGFTVQLAIVAPNADPNAAWITGSWETDNSGTSPRYLARIEAGVDFVLTAGDYEVWWQIDGPAPEAPVGKAPDLLTVF